MVGLEPPNQKFDLFGGGAFPGLYDWGIGFFIVWLAATTLLCLRTVGRDAVLHLDLPVADWFVFATAGVLMAIFALTTIDNVAFGGGLAGLRYGWWLAMIAAVLVIGGALLMRDSLVTE